ncbi:MAG: glutamine synthetase, partial [Marivita lacus]|nr:glutamine synthetase [Marivita lacus]
APPEPVKGNAYALDLPQVPGEWASAIAAFESSTIIPRIFHEELIRNLVLTKKQEHHYMKELTPAERVEIYLDTV